MIVLDDHHLFSVLSGTESDRLFQERTEGTATTGSWLYRLARAVGSGDARGALSRRLAALEPSLQIEVIRLIDDLPPDIETVNPRDVVPVMRWISTQVNANYLTLEGVATAALLGADLVVSVSSPLLDRVASAASIRIRLLAG